MAYQATANVKRIAYELTLQEESQPADILTGLMGTYNDRDRELPNGILLHVDLAGFNTKNINLIKDLNGSGRQGDQSLTGFTEEFQTKSFICYSTDVRHGVNVQNFGKEADLLEPYGILKRANPALAKWFRARRGKHIRQAACQGISDNLSGTPANLTAGLNKNILVKNVSETAQPAYSKTLSTYTSNLNTALNSAGVGASAQMSLKFLQYVKYYATSKWFIEPLENGKYVLLIPETSALLLKDITDSSSYLGKKSASFVQEFARQAFDQYLGDFGDLMLFSDPRGPILNNNAGVLTFGYRDVGSVDTRGTVGVNNVYDCSLLFGRNAIVYSDTMKERYDDEYSDIGKFRDIGATATYGYQVLEFDNDTGTTDTSRIAQNCALILSAKPTAAL